MKINYKSLLTLAVFSVLLSGATTYASDEINNADFRPIPQGDSLHINYDLPKGGKGTLVWSSKTSLEDMVAGLNKDESSIQPGDTATFVLEGKTGKDIKFTKSEFKDMAASFEQLERDTGISATMHPQGNTGIFVRVTSLKDESPLSVKDALKLVNTAIDSKKPKALGEKSFKDIKTGAKLRVEKAGRK